MLNTRWVNLCLSLLLSTTSFAQHMTSYRDAASVGQNINDQLSLLQTRKVLYGEGANSGTIGTPYLTETFDSANVHTLKGVFRAVPIRYNIFEDYLEFKDKEAVYILDPSLQITKVDFGSSSFVVEMLGSGTKKKLGFFELLDSGKVTLVAKKEVYFREAQPTRGIVEAVPPTFSRKSDEYFFKIEKGQLNEVGSIKNMIASFPDNHDKLKEFARNEKISKDREDLIKLVRYYNSL